MSLDRSPSPNRNGGWSSPGLTAPFDEDHNHGAITPTGASPGSSPYSKANGAGGVTWANAKKRSARVNGYPSYQSTNQGFFTRHMRKISESLPQFANAPETGLKDKPSRSQSGVKSWKELPKHLALLILRRRKLVLMILLPILLLCLLFSPPVKHWYRRNVAGGKRIVLILGANQGGGVMEWKGAREWAIERDSVKNKRNYASRWGYELEIVDMSTKKRYAHEWRESWEKVDAVRNAMKKYPRAEWFWWLDLHTLIMEPSISIQKQLLNDLKRNTYRDINYYNPLRIQHPHNGSMRAPGNDGPYFNYFDPETNSPTGDDDPNSINMLLTQDCAGFNLGSFLMKRSAWADRIMDIWWDPVFYEQKHMEWEHKEQDALEYLYTNQPWIRSHMGFIPQRKMNSFPSGACGDDRGIPAGGCARAKPSPENECGVQGVHYQKSERDFLINMAGCEWGRDCWGEIYYFRQMSNWLNRTRWEKFKDWISDTVKHLRGVDKKA